MDQATKKLSRPREAPLRPGSEGLALYVLGDGAFAMYPLPERQTIIIGRADDVDVRIDDATLSRRHARLVTGAPLTLEDLGSANGTMVGARLLPPGEAVPIAPGHVMTLGSVTALIVRAGTATDPTSRAEPAEAPTLASSLASTTQEMRQLYRIVDRVASSDVSVLIYGETGVGKEVTAETLHRRSPRFDRPLLRLNCGALPDALLESELFGYERGAFTGAQQAKMGLLESADGGTVFLDEIGEMPATLQVKILRVIEHREIMRIGGLRPRPIDVRFIAATHRDLEAEIARGTFRQDLFFRLNAVSLTIPPLRERTAEIEGLAQLFIVQTCAKSKRTALPTLSREVLAALLAHSWPGNIRELRHVVERAVVLCEGDEILLEHLDAKLIPSSRRPADGPGPSLSPSGDPFAADERGRIIEALERCAGNQTQAARLLGISRGTLLSRIQRYNLPRPRGRR